MSTSAARPPGLRAPQPAVCRERTWRTDRPLDVMATWGPLRRGRGDPAWSSQSSSGGVELWRGIRLPAGPVTLRLVVRTQLRQVNAALWAAPEHADLLDPLLHNLPDMLGESDDPEAFRPEHPVLQRAQHDFPGWRMPHTGLVLESLVPAIIEQKVTGMQAFASWRRLVRRYGAPAPGPGAARELWVPPAAETMRGIPSWQWLQLGISPQRADVLARVLTVAHQVERVSQRPRRDGIRALRSIPGVGVWTAAETAQRALGDADAVSFGDYHVAANVGWSLTGVPASDHEMEGLLAPYVGHRYRVQRLLSLAGHHRPRRGPRLAPPTHLPTSKGY